MSSNMPLWTHLVGTSLIRYTLIQEVLHGYDSAENVPGPQVLVHRRVAAREWKAAADRAGVSVEVLANNRIFRRACRVSCGFSYWTS